MDDRPDTASEPVATLDHLTGGAEGIQSTLHGETLDVFLHANKSIHIAPARTGSKAGRKLHACIWPQDPMKLRRVETTRCGSMENSCHLICCEQKMSLSSATRGRYPGTAGAGGENPARSFRILLKRPLIATSAGSPCLPEFAGRRRVYQGGLRARPPSCFAGRDCGNHQPGITGLSAIPINVMLQSNLARERANMEKFAESWPRPVNRL